MSISRAVKQIALAVFGLALTLSAVRAGDVVVVVSAQSPVTNISRNQIADIFLGKTNRLPSGEDAVPIDQPEASPVREEFYNKFTGKSDAQIKAHWSKMIFTGRGQPPRQASSSAEVKKLVAENPRAIGYIDQSLADSTVRVLSQ
jgi:ABC-type phosphate transport system substrate-binding protein